MQPLQPMRPGCSLCSPCGLAAAYAAWLQPLQPVCVRAALQPACARCKPACVRCATVAASRTCVGYRCRPRCWPTCPSLRASSRPPRLPSRCPPSSTTCRSSRSGLSYAPRAAAHTRPAAHLRPAAHTLALLQPPLPRCSPPHHAVPPHQVEFVAKKGPEAEFSSFNVDGNLFKTAVLRMEAPSAHLATPSHT